MTHRSFKASCTSGHVRQTSRVACGVASPQRDMGTQYSSPAAPSASVSPGGVCHFTFSASCGKSGTWGAAAANGSEQSTFSTGNWQASGGPPGSPPSGMSPSGSVTTRQPLLSCNWQSGVSGYSFAAFRDSDGQALDSGNLSCASSTCSHLLSTQLSDGNYHWSAWPANSCGGGPGGSQSFNVPPLQQPSALSYTQLSSGVTLSWNQIPMAKFYRVRLAPIVGGSQPQWGPEQVPNASCANGQCSWTFNPGCGQYQWEIQSVDDLEQSAYSSAAYAKACN